MPEMELENPSAERPIISLPKGAPETVAVFVQVAKAVAGCYICHRPIPKGTTRITFRCVVEPPFEQTEGQPTHRRVQRYSVHVGCLTKPMGSEVKRDGTSCYDCGASYPKGTPYPSGTAVKSGDVMWGLAFTTHRFAPAALCPTCCTKQRWKMCGNCVTYFPLHMVSPGEIVGTKVSAAWEEFDVVAGPVQDRGLWCVFCAERYGVSTVEALKEQTEQWEETRRQIMESGPFLD